VEHNRLLKNARIETGRADIRVSASKINYLPRIGFTIMGGAMLTSLEFDLPPNAIGKGGPSQPVAIKIDTDFIAPIIARFQQPLSDLYRIHLDVRAGKVGRQIVQETFRETRQDVVHQVQSTYFAILKSQSELEAVEQDVVFYTELKRVVEERVKAKRALDVDVWQVLEGLAEARHRQLLLVNAVDQGKEKMNSLMGRDVWAPLEVAEVPETVLPPLDFEAASHQALAQRPEMRQAHLRLTQARVECRSEKLQGLPKLNFEILSLSIFNVPVVPKETAVLGATLSWDFFDWGRPLKAIQDKKLAVLQAANRESQLKSNILLEVSETYRRVMEARSMVEVGEVSEKAGKARLEIAMARYRHGEALLARVLDARADYEDARQTRRQAELSYLTARADFQRALGEDQSFVRQ